MKRLFILALLAGILVLPAVFFRAGNGRMPGSAREPALLDGDSGYGDIVVTRTVDGDTLVLSNGERVRLLGIDTPEIHESQKLYRDSQRTQQDIATIKAMGERAHEFTRRLLEGKRVSLEFDVERKDKYGRLLAYVYLKEGTFVNEEVVRQGFASLMTYPPNVKYADVLLKAYRDARENKRGLWQ